MPSRSALPRRRFLALAAAAAAALAAPAGAAPPAPRRRRPAPAPPAPPPAEPTPVEREVARQRQGTQEVLKTLRAHPLPPGGDLPVVFRTVAPLRRGR
jgi:hypothetical protein